MTVSEMLEEVISYTKHFILIDFEIATKEKCNVGHSMEYRGFKKGDSYRAFCVCEKCNIAEEF